MKKLALLLWIPLLLFACVSEQPKKRVYTEKDIEGYWALYSALNETELGRDFAVQNGGDPTYSLLRFFNDGTAGDGTGYSLRGDTIFLPRYVEPRAYKMAPAFVISFFSAERLVLRSLAKGTEETYYPLNLSVGEETTDYKISLLPHDGGLAFHYTGDSLLSEYIPYSDKRISCFISHPSRSAVNDTARARINALCRNLDQNDLLFSRSIYVPRTYVNDSVFICSFFPSGILQIDFGAQTISINNPESAWNPYVRALYRELAALIRYHN